MMIYHKQRFRHLPEEGQYGDCMRTVLACLLDKQLDEVPHFLQDFCKSTEFNRRVDAYLKSQGLSRWVAWYPGDLKGVLECQADNNPDLYWLLSGTSPRGCCHVVICKGGEIIHDTALDATEQTFIGPCSNDHWEVEVLTPLLTERNKDD